MYKKDLTLLDPGVDRLVELTAAAGVRGLETIYSYNHNKPYFKTPAETIDIPSLHKLISHFENLADKLNLVKTGGCDYHGLSKPQIQVGELPVPYRYLTNLKAAVGRE